MRESSLGEKPLLADRVQKGFATLHTLELKVTFGHRSPI